jgi:hypothetical protein
VTRLHNSEKRRGKEKREAKKKATDHMMVKKCKNNHKN